MKISVKLDKPSKIANRILQNDAVGLFVANTWGRYFSPYVPMDEGILDQTREETPFKVTYVQPYSNRIHNGKGFNFSTEKHPLATSHWENASYAVNKPKVAKEITEFIKKQ